MKRIIWLILSLIILLSAVLLYYFNYNNSILSLFLLYVQKILNWIFLSIIISIIFLVIKENENPIKTIAWIQVLIFLPIIGFILYIFLGINYRKKRIFKNKTINDHLSIERSEHILTSRYKPIRFSSNSQNVQRLITLLYENSKAILSEYNECTFYFTGKDALINLFNEIKKAKHSVHLEYFTIRDDQTGNCLKEILLNKLNENVEVRIIYDAVGSWRTKRNFWEDLRKSGAECYPFSPLLFPYLSSKLNYRDHRKIAIIDGNVSFIGGVNIGNQYMGLSKRYSLWADAHLKIIGEASALIQQMFLLDWVFVSKKNFPISRYFPEINNQSKKKIQIISSGPDTNWENIHQAYFTIISSARKYLYIQTPYMFLDESILTALKIAGLSGVDVKILLPKQSDHKFVHLGTRSYYYELIQANISIYEYRNGFMHAKVIIADDEYASVGSANMDIRSFSQNFEINAILYDLEDICILKDNFIKEISNADLIDNQWIDKRRWYKKLGESISRLFSPIF